MAAAGCGATASLSESTCQIAQAGDTGSMDVHYTIPKASGVSQVVFAPAGNHSVTLGENSAGQEPTAVGVWIKGIGGTPGTPLANNELTFAEVWAQVNGQDDVFYPTTVTYNGWQLITAALPAGTAFPLTLNFLDFLVINPSSTTTGDVYVADLEGLYSPRLATPYVYTAVPQNPSWLQFDENPAQFAKGGVTVCDRDHADRRQPGSAPGAGRQPGLARVEQQQLPGGHRQPAERRGACRVAGHHDDHRRVRRCHRHGDDHGDQVARRFRPYGRLPSRPGLAGGHVPLCLPPPITSGQRSFAPGPPRFPVWDRPRQSLPADPREGSDAAEGGPR